LVLKPHAIKFKKEKEIEKEKERNFPGIFGDTLISELDDRLAVLSS
jgi:hypothetical protein